MRDGYRVRRAEPSDASALAALCVEHARYERAEYALAGKAEALSRILSASPARLQAWVAETRDGLVGYATATLEFSTWAARDYLHMDCLFVCEQARGRSIGVALLDAVVDCARRNGVETIEWQTPDWNLDAARFYRRQGAMQRHKLRFSLSVQA